MGTSSTASAMRSPVSVGSRVIGNWQTSAPSSPLPTLSRNRSFSSMSSLGTSVCSQSSKLVSTFSRTTSSPAKIGIDKGEGNTGLDDLSDSFEEIRESRQLVCGRSYRSSSPECTYFFRTEIFWRRYSREKLRQRDPAQRSVSSGTMRRSTSLSSLVTRPCSDFALPDRHPP